MARRVGLSRTAVQSRLRLWRRDGLDLGCEVWPNPRLFGAKLCTVDIPLDTPAQVDRLLDDLAMVEGVISARDLLDEDGRTVRAYVIDDGEVGLSRRHRLLRRVAGLREVPELQPYWIPATFGELSPMDWRILSMYRSYPETRLSDAATALGISTKTLSSRRDRLLDGHAMWWLLNLQSSLFPVASFFNSVTDPSAVPTVKRALEALPSGWIPCADDGFGISPKPPVRIVAGLLPLDSPVAVDDVVRDIARCQGVESVRWRIPRTFRSYPEWYDRHILAQLADSARARRSSSGVSDDAWIETIPSAAEISGTELTTSRLPEPERFTPDNLSHPPARTVEEPQPEFGGRRGRRFASAGPAV